VKELGTFPTGVRTDNAAIDVVKTRIQIDSALKGKSLLSGGRQIVAAEGAKGLLTGFGPTAVGYLFQGGAKFAGYEAAVCRQASLK
jgi:solute carrier family 25 phosphate transporter 3